MILLALACNGPVAVAQPPPASLPASPAPPPAPEATVPAPTETLALEAIVTAYRPNAMRDHSDESFTVFDAAEVRVTSPPEHAGLALVFFLSPPAAPDAPWRDVGALLCFRLRPGDLAPGRQLFGAAAKDLQRC